MFLAYLQGFVEGFLANKLSPYYKSQRIPEQVTFYNWHSEFREWYARMVYSFF